MQLHAFSTKHWLLQLNPFCKQGKGWDLFVMGHLSRKAFLMSWITPIICSHLSSPPRTALNDHIWGDFYRVRALTTMHYFWAKASDKLLGQLGHISDESEHGKAAPTIHLQAPGFTSIRSHLLWNLSPDRMAHTSWNLQALLSTRVFEIVKKKKNLAKCSRSNTMFPYLLFLLCLYHINFAYFKYCRWTA